MFTNPFAAPFNVPFPYSTMQYRTGIVYLNPVQTAAMGLQALNCIGVAYMAPISYEAACIAFQHIVNPLRAHIDVMRTVALVDSICTTAIIDPLKTISETVVEVRRDTSS